MDFQLQVVRGRSATSTLKLADGVTTVGRRDDCQLRIRSSQVSRRHCQLFEKKGLLLVKDLGSSNGTFVNGERIEDQRVLSPGDELTVGQIKLRVQKVAAAAAAQPAAPASKPGDTAVGLPSPVAESHSIPLADDQPIPVDDDRLIPMSDDHPIPVVGLDDEYEINFDDEPDAPTVMPPPAAKVAPPPAAKTKPGATPARPQPEPTRRPAIELEAGEGEEAVADFLKAIRLDDD
jgi:predicted component of type VI protein secretion system